jgi:hypothetical protein
VTVEISVNAAAASFAVSPLAVADDAADAAAAIWRVTLASAAVVETADTVPCN